jgi:hypothetical protein
VTIAKRAHDRLDFLLEDASAGRAHPSWLSHRMVRLPTSLQVRRLLRPPCGGRCRVDEMVADRFDSLVEAMRYLLLCLYVHARLARQADGSWG